MDWRLAPLHCETLIVFIRDMCCEAAIVATAATTRALITHAVTLRCFKIHFTVYNILGIHNIQFVYQHLGITFTFTNVYKPFNSTHWKPTTFHQH